MTQALPIKMQTAINRSLLNSKLINSDKYSDMDSESAKKAIIEFLENKNAGSVEVNYKLRITLTTLLGRTLPNCLAKL